MSRQIPDTVLRVQTEASDPEVSAFVAANAGSGKTHVLVQRVIRLLLNGVDPAKILCITFTKAAAANMATRVFRELSKWISLDDDALDQAIRAIGAKPGGEAQRARARRLFAAALETPGGLKVQTIHAFCTRVLHQFPFEAKVSARFSVLDDRAQNELLERATTSILLDAAAEPQSPLGRALTTAISFAADTTFRDVIRELIGKRDALMAWIDRAGGVTEAVAELSRALGLDPADDLKGIEADIVDGPILPASEWAGVAAVCEASSSRDQDQGGRLRAAQQSTGAARIETYLKVFFDSKFKPRANILTKPLASKESALAARLLQEQTRVTGLRDKRNAVICRDRTAALVTIGREVIARYRADKNRRGLLDYDDLIEKTLALLDSVNPGWVHYKLDMGIDHLLVDEAQDTSPKQWDIITRLVSEFTAGAGARTIRRTIFAVGDEKQSIFSFQGAAPREFAKMRRHFQRAHDASGLAFLGCEFKHSFRSGPNVLDAVNEVFRSPEIAASITTDADGIAPHLALAGAAPGLVEIWDLVKPEGQNNMEGWAAPFDAVPETSPQVVLARKIAAAVDPQRAGDVLVLVRQRGALFEAVIRALKDRNIPVAGADRLVLTEHIAVIDLMALADAVLLPHDDLALAVALKSPLFDSNDGNMIDDDDLFRLAWGRSGTLRAALADATDFAEADAQLKRCVAVAQSHTPFGFYAWLLGAAGGRRRILRRLGPEAADALDEFLELALDYERREAPTLQGFLAWLRAAEVEIKRDMEISRNEVRVMTVHGAKGLEAPVVFLADTTTTPTGPRAPRLLGVPAENAPPDTPDRIIWAGRKADDPAPVGGARQRALDEAENEYRRLLYVAMTRAADRLIVAGCIGERKAPEGCWYNLVKTGLTGKNGWSESGDGEEKIYRYRKTPGDDAAATAPTVTGGETIALPGWLKRGAPGEKERIAHITPSTVDDEAPAARSASGEDRNKALLRGRLVHRLLQSLPELQSAARESAARTYLARAGKAFDATEREDFVRQTLAVMEDARFAPLFAPGSRAELPIVGRLARPGRAEISVSGQIDRLAITPEAVLIGDFKTNRPAPRTLAEVPEAYVAQLALYRAVLMKLYPDLPVRAVLVWTDVPDFMELSAATLNAALLRVTSA